MVRSSEHVGIGYMAALLRLNDYPVYIDEYSRSDDSAELIGRMRKRGVRVIGFTTTVVNIKTVIELTGLIRKELPNTVILYGGHVVTFNDPTVLADVGEADILVRGEGEETILEILKSLEYGKDLSTVRGIVYRDRTTGQILQNPDRPRLADLDQLPFPARDQFESHRKDYHYLRICTSRGCYGNCSFCSNYVGRKLAGPQWRGRSPANVVDEIELLVKKHSFHTFDFVDSTFEDPPGETGKTRIRAIAEEIIRRGLNIYYNCCFRAENWTEADHGLLDLLVMSGLEKANVGFEAGNDRGLRTFGKRAKVKDNRRLIQVLSRHPQIYLTYGFIFYHPYQTFEDMEDNARFLYQSGMGHISRHYFWRLEVYPGTRIRESLIRDGLYCEKGLGEDPYSYSYVDPRVGSFATRMAGFLKEEAVWDFEIFDILVHTYVFRLLRHFGQDKDVRASVEEFRDWLRTVRSEIAEFNYELFTRWLAASKSEWEPGLVRKAEELKIGKYLTEKKKLIRDRQLRLGMVLKKRGISFSALAR